MKFFERYKFTDKKHSAIGIMSVNLGVVSLISSVGATVLPYLTKSGSVERYAFTMVLSVFLAFIGLVLSIIGKISGRVFDFFPKLGLIINSLVMIFSAFIIYQGR